MNEQKKRRKVTALKKVTLENNQNQTQHIKHTNNNSIFLNYCKVKLESKWTKKKQNKKMKKKKLLIKINGKILRNKEKLK